MAFEESQELCWVEEGDVHCLRVKVGWELRWRVGVAIQRMLPSQNVVQGQSLHHKASKAYSYGDSVLYFSDHKFSS